MRVRTLAVSTLSLTLLAACSGHSSTTSSSGTSTTSAAPSSAAAAAAGDFGDLKGLCGPGDAKGATAPGVTDTSIAAGTLADPGNVVQPGIDQELFDASSAFVKWCNESGGILGRKITLTLRDAKLFQAQARMTEACAADFAVVGGGLAFDGQAAPTRIKCGLAEVGAFENAITTVGQPLGIVAEPTVNPTRLYITQFRQIAAAYPEAIKHYGYLTAELGNPGRPLLDREKEALTPVGYSFVYNAIYPATGVDNWRPYVEAMKSQGVQVLEFIGGSDAFAAMQKSMRDVGYYPQVMLGSGNFYDPALITNGGDALKNTFITQTGYPFEKAADNPPTQQMMSLIKKYVPNGKIAALSVNSWSAWTLFATAAKACGSNLTRDCLISTAKKQTSWTGGGIHAPFAIDVTAPDTPVCGVLLDATASGFTLDTKLTAANTGVYNCDVKNFGAAAS